MGKMMDALKKARAIREGRAAAHPPDEESVSPEGESVSPEGVGGSAVRESGATASVTAESRPAPSVSPRPLTKPVMPSRTSLEAIKDIKPVEIPPDKRQYVVTALERAGHSAEEFRDLKQRITSGPKAQKRRVILVTGPAGGEGKSTVAVNLALVLAENAGYRVLVVDADLSKPELPTVFGLESGTGLAEMLLGRAAAEEAVRPTGLGNLWVLGAGKSRDNPKELMVPGKLQAVMEELARRFRYVVVDGPGPLRLLEGAELGSAADAVLLVLRRKQTDKRQAAEAVRLIRNRGAEVLGCVLVDA